LSLAHPKPSAGGYHRTQCIVSMDPIISWSDMFFPACAIYCSFKTRSLVRCLGLASSASQLIRTSSE